METKNENKHVCPYSDCSRTFSEPNHLRLHLRDHKEEMPYRCTHEGCPGRYKRPDHLTRHMRETHSQTSELWRCTESDCEMVFKNQQNMKKHILRKHKEDRFKCKVIGCGLAFKKHHQLKAHSAVHNQDLPYICKEPGCAKAFPLLSKLLRHAKIHEGYFCKQEGCEARFEKWTHLLKHRKLQHGTEYTCDVCQKAFRQRNRLKRHLLTHTDNRVMFVCTADGCGREYTQNRNLQAHILSYHKGKRWPCEHAACDQTFSTKQKLQLHMDLHDPDKHPKQKKPRKKKAPVESLTGISLETESRGQDSVLALKSPEQQHDRLELSDLDKSYSAQKTKLRLPQLLGTFSRKRSAVETPVCPHSSESDNVDSDEEDSESDSKKLKIDFSAGSSSSSEEVSSGKHEVVSGSMTMKDVTSLKFETDLSGKSEVTFESASEMLDKGSCNKNETVSVTAEKGDMIEYVVSNTDSVHEKSEKLECGESSSTRCEKGAGESVTLTASTSVKDVEKPAIPDANRIIVNAEVYTH